MNHYLSVGQFNQDSNAFDGPGGDPDGVHRLDSASIYLDLSQLDIEPPYAFIGADCKVVVPGFWLGSQMMDDSSIQGYPNPTSGYTQVVLSGSVLLENIDLLNLDGRLIDSFVVKPGQYRFEISLDDLAPGPYQLRINGPSGFKTSLIVKAL